MNTPGMHRTLEAWAKVKPNAFLDGSIVQARNVIEMAQQDIAQLGAALDAFIKADSAETLAEVIEGLRVARKQALTTLTKARAGAGRP